MQRLTYTVMVRPAKLMDELLAAIPALQPVNLQPNLALESTATQCWVTVPDSVASSSVDAVVAAHDPNTPSAAEQQATADTASLSDWSATISSMLSTVATDLTDVATDLTTLNASTWDGLTGAQRTAAMRRLATRQHHLLTGSQRLLKALAVFVRRQGA